MSDTKEFFKQRKKVIRDNSENSSCSEEEFSLDPQKKMKEFMNYDYDTLNPEERQKLILENQSKQVIKKRIQVKPIYDHGSQSSEDSDNGTGLPKRRKV